MKFNDGYWRLQAGTRVAYPQAAYDVQPSPRDLTVRVPTRPIDGRRKTLNTPVVTVRGWSPMPDVVGVRITHFGGGQPTRPAFALQADPDSAVRVSVEDAEAVLTSGSLSARFDLGAQWGVRFMAGDRLLTSSGYKSMGVVDTDDGGHYIHERLALGLGECVYGLGERFTSFVKNGQSVDVWNDDGGTASGYAYKNVPFYLTNHGYGVFVNTPDRVSYEIGSEFASRVQFSVRGQSLEYFIIYGPSPKEILRKYTALTGRPALPPSWSFGLWLTTSFVTSYDEATVTEFVDGMAERDLPLSVFHFDCFWMREFHWCDFEWDRRAFPDPEGMLRRLKERGLRVSAWINPYIAEQSSMFEEGKRAGYLLKRPSGEVWQWDVWQAGMAIVDFTNPAARQWYADKLGALLEMGVDCFKTDFGERIPTDVVYFDGSDPVTMHNYYSYLYNETVFETIKKYRGEGEAVVFARSATTGGQQFPVHWGGDPEPTYTSMAESLRGGLSLGMSGFGFWSHDIGGFEGNPTPELFKRWAAFGLLSSHSRLHGSITYRVPWLFGDEAVDVVRHFTKLKMRLMPYLWRAAIEAHRDGVPMMRAMALEFPDDPTCLPLDRQYMLGPDLLVAPVFCDDGEVTYYVPAGEWTNFLTGERVAGPRWVTERHDFFGLPLLVRPGAVIPVGARQDRPDYDYGDGVTLEVFAFGDGDRTVVRVPAGDGGDDPTFVLTRQAGRVRVEAQTARPWRVLLVGVGGGVQPHGAETVDRTRRGTVVAPGGASPSVEFTVPSAAATTRPGPAGM
jgi:alpha-D-xyloside xylohydrolase